MKQDLTKEPIDALANAVKDIPELWSLRDNLKDLNPLNELLSKVDEQFLYRPEQFTPFWSAVCKGIDGLLKLKITDNEEVSND